MAFFKQLENINRRKKEKKKAEEYNRTHIKPHSQAYWYEKLKGEYSDLTPKERRFQAKLAQHNEGIGIKQRIKRKRKITKRKSPAPLVRRKTGLPWGEGTYRKFRKQTRRGIGVSHRKKIGWF